MPISAWYYQFGYMVWNMFDVYWRVRCERSEVYDEMALGLYCNVDYSTMRCVKITGSEEDRCVVVVMRA